MLTIFTIPKPFRGDITVIQRNALQSWLKLRPQCEVILFGNEDGVGEIASEFLVRHIPDVELNEYGTPLVNVVFDIAQQLGTHQLMCYANADIILLNDFLEGVQQVHELESRFLLMGRRWDIDLKEEIDFANADWEAELRTYVAKVGKLHPATGIDYFVFPCGQYSNIPPFAVGRPAWDNWLIYRTRFLRIPVIDATETVTVIHQNHGYEHVPQGVAGTYRGPEGKRNLELAGGASYAFTLYEANSVLTAGGLKRPKLTVRRLYRLFITQPMLHPRLRFIVEYPRYLVRLCTDLYSRLGKMFGAKS